MFVRSFEPGCFPTEALTACTREVINMLSKAMATLPVSDLGRARKFYEETLGLTVREERADGVVFDVGTGSPILVYPSQFAGTNQATAASFSVDDVASAAESLREKGVVFEEYDLPGLKTDNGIAEIEGNKGAWFKDPDGNILAIADIPV